LRRSELILQGFGIFAKLLFRERVSSVTAVPGITLLVLLETGCIGMKGFT